MTKLWLTSVLSAWVVLTAYGPESFQKKLNELPPYVMHQETTRITQAGKLGNDYTIIYWDRK